MYSILIYLKKIETPELVSKVTPFLPTQKFHYVNCYCFVMINAICNTTQYYILMFTLQGAV